MLFSSLVFLFLFFPLFLLVYYIAKKRYTRNIILLVFSLFFYAWGEPLYILLIIFSIIFNFLTARAIEDKYSTGNNKAAKTLMVTDVCVNLLFIIVFKYTGFLTGIINSIYGSEIFPVLEIALPIGISFYTFQIMSYVIDVYRRQVPAQKNILFLGAYLAAFPQLIAGPVVRYKTVADELENRTETTADFSEGLKRFIIGLSKKVLIANTMAFAADNILSYSASDYGIIGGWLAILAYTVQIYFDFFGYSDMAIGIGRMMGFHYLENFNRPYSAVSISDFWRRWHISMSTFFRDYVYIPLSGNRVSHIRWILNMLIVWSLTGLWHGADWTFIIWGLYFGTILIIERLFTGKYIEKLPVIRNIYALFLIVMGWVIFRADSISHMFEIFRAMFGGYGIGGAAIPLPMVLQQSECGLIFYITLCAAVVICLPASSIIRQKLRTLKTGIIISDILIIAAFIICVIELSIGSYNPFIYFDF
ncbi:MAG: MBOAT family O-acyltransferase [Eubacteriales bacterium]